MNLVETAKNALRSQYVYWTGGLLTAALLLLAAGWLGWLGALLRSPWLWLILALLSGVAVFAAIRWGVPWIRERRFVRREGSDYVVAGEESPEEFQAKFSKALQLLHSMPQLRGKANPLYALPWYLLVGDRGAGKTAAVRGSALFSPLLPAATDGGTQNFDWWVSNSAVVLDTAGRYAQPVDPARDRAEWYRLLRLLHHHRSLEPINGLVVAVAADWLVTTADDQLRADASKLRDRLEEAVRELGTDFPVYLLVTKCDVIEGFGEFFALLPERMHAEVVGYVDDPTAATSEGSRVQPGGATLARLAAALQSIYDRLHMFRMSLLDGKASEEQRQAIFCFPEEFKALQRPLLAFAETLLSEDVRYHTPRFRALFFSSAQAAAARLSLLRQEFKLGEGIAAAAPSNKAYFLNDLFDIMLPRDRGLTSLTPREQRRRGLGRVLRAGVLVAALFIAAAAVTWAFVVDRHIAASVDPGVCGDDAPQIAAAPHLDAVEQCRQAVLHLTDEQARRSRWSTWLFNRGGRLEDTLRQRYARQFRSVLLAPLNNEIDRAFRGSTDPLPLMLLLAQRIQADRRCAAASGCSERAVVEMQPDYALMLSPRKDRVVPASEVNELQLTYTAYLVWLRGEQTSLQQDLADDQKRLRQWLSTKQFSLDSLLPLVNKRSPPMTYDDYWQLPAPFTDVPAPQIDAACTKKIWEQDVAPFLQQLQDAVPDAAPQLRTFQKEYDSICLNQWRRFLVGFTRGADRWKGAERQRTQAMRLLTADSACVRIIDAAVTNVAPWLPADAASVPAWANELKQYASSTQRTAYQDALAKISGRLERGTLPEASFKFAQEAFAEGKPTAESTNPVLHAWWLANQGQTGGAAAPAGDDAVLRPLLQDPLQFVWRVVLQEAGAYVQTAWADTVIAPLKGLTPAEQLLALYGPGGKIPTFTEQVLHPFVTGEDGTASSLLGAAVPFSPQFTQLLAATKDLKPALDGGSPPQPVGVVAGGRSEIEATTTFLGEQTIFSVNCSGKAYRITNRPQDPGESSTTVPWSSQGCADVTITIYFFPGGGEVQPEVPAGAKRQQLTRTYTGHAALLQFLQDFATGAHRFPLDDLAGDPDALRSGVRAVTVHYNVEVPPTLTKVVAALQSATLPEDIVTVAPS